MFTRCLLLFLFLLLGAGSARAQQESLASATFKQRLRAEYLHNDTAQAIINLYGKRQAGGAGWIVGAALSAVRIATASSPAPPPGYTYVKANSNGAVATLIALPIAAYGVGKILVYSNGHLQQILADYGAGKTLPRSLRRKLKPRFFAQPIVKYQPVKGQSAK